MTIEVSDHTLDDREIATPLHFTAGKVCVLDLKRLHNHLELVHVTNYFVSGLWLPATYERPTGGGQVCKRDCDRN